MPKPTRVYSGELGLGNAYSLIAMLLAEGALEILSAMRHGGATYFKDLRKLKNTRTGKLFSANTISARLKELENIGAIMRIASTTTNGRNVVAYKITQRGLKALDISSRYETELSGVLKKQ